MELRVLRYFVAVANERNITRAAESLHISQPTLSKQLMDLEDELDLTLFMRGNRTITLTEDGEYFLRKAREILNLVDHTVANLHTRDRITGELAIGANESPNLAYLSSIFKEIREENPDTKFHLQGMTTDHAFERLDKGLLDFVITVGLVNTDKYHKLRLPWTDKGSLLMPIEHPLTQKKSITGKDLENYPIIAFGQEDAYRDLANWMGSSIDKINFVGSFNVPSVGIQMTQAGLGLAFTLEGFSLPDNIVSRPLEPLAKPSLQLFWKKDQTFSPLAQEFLDRVQQ